VSRPPVIGDFLRSAGDHITAATSFRSELPHTAQAGALRHLDRLVAALTRYLTDLPAQTHHIYGPEHDGGTRAAAALVALDRVTQSLRPAAAAAADTGIADAHPAVSHLSAAADHLTAGRDLLHTHFASDPDGIIAASSYWAPLIASGPVTSALLADLAGYLDALAPWITTQDRTSRPGPGTLTSAHLALRLARPWVQAAATAIQATGRAHYPLPERHLLDAIPANAPPPRQPPTPGEPVHELCQRIPLTAERLRYAAFTYAPHARWSPTATSAAWRKDALASAITAHTCEIILRTLAERASQLRLEPAYLQQLDETADHVHQACASWRTVTGHFDILTTGHRRTPGTTPVTAEISDLVQRTGQLAYANPHWTPARAHTSQIRDPASLAPSPADLTSPLRRRPPHHRRAHPDHRRRSPSRRPRRRRRPALRPDTPAPRQIRHPPPLHPGTMQTHPSNPRGLPHRLAGHRPQHHRPRRPRHRQQRTQPRPRRRPLRRADSPPRRPATPPTGNPRAFPSQPDPGPDRAGAPQATHPRPGPAPARRRHRPSRTRPRRRSHNQGPQPGQRHRPNSPTQTAPEHFARPRSQPRHASHAKQTRRRLTAPRKCRNRHREQQTGTPEHPGQYSSCNPTMTLARITSMSACDLAPSVNSRFGATFGTVGSKSARISGRALVVFPAG
jgi:hypothetical protein